MKKFLVLLAVVAMLVPVQNAFAWTTIWSPSYTGSAGSSGSIYNVCYFQGSARIVVGFNGVSGYTFTSSGHIQGLSCDISVTGEVSGTATGATDSYTGQKNCTFSYYNGSVMGQTWANFQTQ